MQQQNDKKPRGTVSRAFKKIGGGISLAAKKIGGGISRAFKKIRADSVKKSEQKKLFSPQRKAYLKRERKRKFILHTVRLSILAALVGVWELVTFLGWIDPFITSSPSRIYETLATIDVADLFMHISTTLSECLIGFTVSSLLGLFIAVLLWWSDFLRRVLEPYMVVLNALPKIALGPIIIIWVGTGMQSIVVMTVLICLIVTIISCLSGFMEVERGKIFLMRSMGASKFKILTKLVLPASLPNLISVFKINVGLAWVGTIMGEYLASKAGLGYLIIYGGQIFKMDLVMTSTVILCILAALMYAVVALGERLAKRRFSTK